MLKRFKSEYECNASKVTHRDGLRAHLGHEIQRREYAGHEHRRMKP